jgi:tetratricopeptide (TPR) repeat protein
MAATDLCEGTRASQTYSLGMGWLDRIREAVGGGAAKHAYRMEDDRLIVTDLGEAKRRFPERPEAMGPEAMDKCECGGRVRRVVVTTAGGGEQVKVWHAYPLAIDGWLCMSCGRVVTPRRMTAAEITEVGQIGVLHGQQGRLDDAEYCFLRAVSSWPGYPVALANLAQVRLQRSRMRRERRDEFRADALSLLRRAFQQPTGDGPEIVVELSRLEAIDGDEQAALRHLSELAAKLGLEDRWRAEALSLAEDIRKGKGLFTRATEMVDDLLMFADRRWTPLDEQGTGRLRESAKLLTAATERDPKAFANWWALGKVHQRLGEHAVACDAFARALDAEPDHIGGCREYVAACLEVGRAAEALPVAERICAKSPGDAGLRANLAIVQLFAGRTDEATKTVDAALRMDPQDRVTTALASVIAAVREGRRKLPRTLAELEGRSAS